ncbi:WD repeat-containing protein 81 [Aplysia californica]|uniref:WD repeat-containing protein 81 n=1 Tax=Aplysia californica TaxID=6500 RepID=A0ABM1A704_APLCA|nr:WD repeat-containing protein 81 [Aplysia californica]
MYDKGVAPEIIKHACEDLLLAPSCCRLLSADRLVCIVTEEWVKHLHKGQISQLTDETEEIDTCKAERYLSRSCDKVPHSWMKITVKAIAKSEELFERIPERRFQKQWSCGSLYEFLSHICKENVANLWLQAHSSLSTNSGQRYNQAEGVTFTSLIRQVIHKLNPTVYIKSQPEFDLNLSSELSSSSARSKIPKDHSGSFNSNGGNSGSNSSSRTSSFHTNIEPQSCFGLVPIDVVVETAGYFYLIQPYYSYSLQDVVAFSPTILEISHAKPLFVIYQLLQAMQALHHLGLYLGEVTISDIVMDKNMWLRVSNPRLSILRSYLDREVMSPNSDSDSMYITANSPDALNRKSSFPFSQDSVFPSHVQTVGFFTNNEKFFQVACEFMKTHEHNAYEITMLDAIVDHWVHRRITNFQYLMILNYLAGRRMGDPNNHPVLPWVLDFSGPDSGYRDLTKSKFRLNKGDGQLDFTYSVMNDVSDSNEHVPHHVSDILSDITYYVYKARRTPKSVLCAHVRSNWVPHEYPISMQRLQDWTPDECIPEFFTDPSIFDSIHEDLPDLEIPTWSKNTLDFVVRHLGALESDHVSSNLHHWIDLTFGFKLSGAAAIKAKNVHLHLVDQHTYLTPHGAVQLFQQPHPQRASQHCVSASAAVPRITRGLLNSQLLTYGFPDAEIDSQGSDSSFDGSDQSRIHLTTIPLPRSYNPLAVLEQCEALQEFKVKALHLPNSQLASTPKPGTPTQFQDEGITRDMVTLLCIICEMFLDSKLRMQDSRPPLWKRVRSIRKLCSLDFSEIQRPVQKFVREMFDSLEVSPDKKFAFQAIFPDGSPPPTPGYLLQPYCDLIPFPSYFVELYNTLNKVEEKNQAIESLKWSKIPLMEKSNRIKQLEREKVPVLETFLWRHQGYLGQEGMALILPYIQDLLQNEFTTVQAAWSLFDVSTRELGPSESTKEFLKSLTALFSGETSSAKHIKLYHRSFLIQLIIRLGMKTFLTYFSTLLVEAVAGYKDFSLTNRFYPEELLEDFNPEEILKSPSAKREQMDWTQSNLRKEGDFSRDGIGEDEVDAPEEESSCSRDEDELDNTMVDRLSLDGEHIPMLDEDAVGKYDSVDSAERDSIDSESSEDRIEVLNIRRKTVMFEDQDGAKEGIYGSADQHSIHSISMLLPKDLTDSPAAGENMEHFHNEFPCGSLDTMSYEALEPGSQSSSTWQQFGNGNKHSISQTLSSGSDSVFEGQIESEGSNQSKASKNHTSSVSSESGVKQSLVSTDSAIVSSNLSSLSPTTSVVSPQTVDPSFTESTNTRLAKQPQRQRSIMTSSPAFETTNAEDERDGNSQKPTRQRTTSDMVRSETEDLMLNLSSDSAGSVINIRDIAADSVKWLSHKLGPVLATKFLSRNLVRMLALCYLGHDQLQFMEGSATDKLIKTSRLIVGDRNANKVLECIGFTIVLYGEQVILIQCLPNIMDMITLAQKRLSSRAESGLIASVVLLAFLVPYISDTTLMNLLEDSFINNCISPVLSLIISPQLSFPSGALSRFVLCHKLIDLMYTLGLRLGFENTRKYLNSIMLRLFDTFSSLHGQTFQLSETIPVEKSKAGKEKEEDFCGSDESYLTIKMDDLTHQYKIGSPVDLRNLKSPPLRRLSKMHSLSSIGIIDEKEDYVDSKSQVSSSEKNRKELKCVFCPELAQACYIPLCRIFGSIHMEEHLHNDDLIRQLCSQHDRETDSGCPAMEDLTPTTTASESATVKNDLQSPLDDKGVVSGIGKNVAVVGNRIQLNETPASTPTQPEVGQFGRGYKHSGILSIHLEDLRSSEMEQNQARHLRGNWLAYWERELGLHERDTMFNFMQIELQTYTGHTSSIRSIYTMDTENCFISASKDKTVRLWSINCCGDGSRKQTSQFCYSRHKKSVFSVAYVESMRLVASCDSTVHVWDPYTGVSVSQLESPKYAPVVALTALPAPSSLVAMATTEATLRFLDMRTSKYTHGFRCSVGNTGLIRCVVVSPNSSWIAVGFSTGYIYILDINSGILLNFWKAHDGEILQMKAYSKTRLLSSAFDQTIKLWNVDSGQEVCAVKQQSEPIHCLSLYRDQLLSATTGNRISVYASISDSTPFASSKLRSAAFKGVLTYMSVLPLNKALLLGADNGVIRLMA